MSPTLLNALRFLPLLPFLLGATLATAQAYRWVDPATGKTVISDTPPPGSVRSVNAVRAAPAAEISSFEVKRAAEAYPVLLYTSPECLADCKDARQVLNTRGVPFTEKMVQSNEEVEELKKLAGQAFVPLLKVGKQVIKGFNADAYNNLLDLAGYPSKAPPGSKPSGGLAR